MVVEVFECGECEFGVVFVDCDLVVVLCECDVECLFDLL